MNFQTGPIDVDRLPRVGLYFRFYGDHFDPDEITRRLGIEPTTRFRPGDPITEDGEGRRRGYGWFLKVGKYPTLDIEDLLNELRELVPVSPAVVKQLCADLNVELIIVCGVGLDGLELVPTLFFPQDFLAWVKELGASLNVDLV